MLIFKVSDDAAEDGGEGGGVSGCDADRIRIRENASSRSAKKALSDVAYDVIFSLVAVAMIPNQMTPPPHLPRLYKWWWLLPVECCAVVQVR